MSQKKILVVGPSWVGDMVMAQSLFMTLVAKNAETEIDVLAPGWSLPLLERMKQVRKGIAMPLGHGQLQLKTRKKLGQSFKENGYDQAIVLPNSLKSALVPFWANIPVRTGFRGEFRWGILNDARKLDKKTLTMTVQRFVALGLPKASRFPPTCPTPHLIVKKTDIETAVEKQNIVIGDEKILALCPGAEYGPAKQWPTDYYAELAWHYINAGWQVWIFGSEKDAQVGNQINQLSANQCVDLTGKTKLAEAIDLMSLASVVVSNDSGLMHVAAGLHRPVVAIYGSSDPNFTPPLTDNSAILTLNLDCSPCFKRECPLSHLKCLQDLKTNRVIAAVTQLITA